MVQQEERVQRREAVTHFFTRLDNSMRKSPPSKQWVKDALHRRGAPRCPVRLKRLSLDIILRHGDGLADLFDAYPEDTAFVQAYDIFIGRQAPGRHDPINPIDVMLEEAEWVDEWGTRWRHAGGGVGASTIANPLTDWEMLDDYLKHMPDPRVSDRLDGVRPALALHGQDRYFAGMAHMALFERFHCLRGMENAFADFYLYPRETERLLDALTDYFVELMRAWGKLPNVNGVFMSDDWGTQGSMMISAELWRKFFARRYRRIFDAVHSAGLDVLFHSCGNVTDIIGDLIDAGIDVLDPLQPEAMDLKKVATKFGGKVAFCGGISDQMLERLNPGQIRDHVRRAIDILGTAFHNAYIVAPSNVLPPETPLANLEALFEACHGG